MKPVTKAVIAAAGFGTRFLPQTKAMPKEMLPIIDKPIIQYVVEELVEAGIKDIIIVGSSNKRAIEDHFDEPNADLLANLQSGGPKKQPYIDLLEKLSGLANFVYIRQKGPYGNATPIVNAAHLLGDEPFIYTFADDFFVAPEGRTRQLIRAYERHNSSVFACKRVVNSAEYDRYGIVDGDEINDGELKISKIDEKPGQAAARSNLASVSGYLFEPAILSYLDKALSQYAYEGEFMIQPVIQSMIDEGHTFVAREIKDGTYYDTGDKLEYLKTVIDFGLDHPEFGSDLRDFLSRKLSK